MKLLMFSVYDQAVQSFMPPIFSRARGEALRSFTDACNEEKSNFYKHAADYALFYLGEYDDQSASFECPSVPQRVISALECVADPFTAENKAPDSPLSGNGVKRLPM